VTVDQTFGNWDFVLLQLIKGVAVIRAGGDTVEHVSAVGSVDSLEYRSSHIASKLSSKLHISAVRGSLNHVVSPVPDIG
jgi:hypothetical protein